MSTGQTGDPSLYHELLDGVQRLNTFELEQFTAKVIALQSQRKAPHLTSNETELLLKINQGIPAEIQSRYHTLIEKRESEMLTENEYEALLTLTEAIEKIEAKRSECLAELARLRQTTLPSLMKELGIQSPKYA